MYKTNKKVIIKMNLETIYFLPWLFQNKLPLIVESVITKKRRPRNEGLTIIKSRWLQNKNILCLNLIKCSHNKRQLIQISAL